MRKRALLILNQRSRRGREEHGGLVRQLEGCGFTLIEPRTRNAGDLVHAIREHRKAVDLIIIAGGDGTLNAAVDALVETQLPVGIIPLGTANDLARTLKLPIDLPAACEVIRVGHTQRIDLGWVNGKHFFNVASLGLSVQICRQLTRQHKSRWGILAYVAAAVRVLWGARPFHAVIHGDGSTAAVKTLQIAVGNGCYYGGGLAVDKDARLDDQRLHLYSLEVRNWWQVIFLLPALLRGTLGDSIYARTMQGNEFEVLTRRRRPINTDGEVTTATPARFRVIPQVLSVFVPAAAEPSCP